MADKKISDYSVEDTAPGDDDWMETETTGGNSRKTKVKNLRRRYSYEGGPPLPPVLADFAWVNQGTSAAADGTGALVFEPQANGQPHYLVKTAPAKPFDVYMRSEFDYLSLAANTTFQQAWFGLALRDSSDGEALTFSTSHYRINGDENSYSRTDAFRWNGAASNAFVATPISFIGHRRWPWIRANVTTTTITLYVSQDGKNWKQVGTETIATFLDAVDQIGIAGYSETDGTSLYGVVSYFGTTSPY